MPKYYSLYSCSNYSEDKNEISVGITKASRLTESAKTIIPLPHHEAKPTVHYT